MNPELSILVKVISGSESLGRFFSGIDFSKDNDCEFILISDEKDKEACEPFLKNPSVRMAVADDTASGSVLMSLIGETINGNFVSYLTSEDYFYPWALSFITINLKKHPDTVCGLLSVPQNDYFPYPMVMTSKQMLSAHFGGSFSWPSSSSGIIFAKRVLPEIISYLSGDRLLFLSCCYDLAFRYPFLLFPDSLLWVKGNANMVGSEHKKHIMDSELLKIAEFKKAKKNHNFDWPVGFSRDFRWFFFRRLLRNLKHFEFRDSVFYAKCWISLITDR